MSKSLAPVKPKLVSGIEWKWIAVAMGFSVFFLITTAIVFSLCLNMATKAAAGTAVAGTQLLATYGQSILQGMENTLSEGTDESRLAILNELSKVDYANSPIPPQLFDAVQSNLEHENKAIRDAAQSALTAMKQSPMIEGTK